MSKVEEQFFEQWNIYQNIIKHNYMCHQEIIEVLKDELSDKKEFSVLDLGCGDSYVLKHSINETQNISYTGVDSSNAALEFSKKNLDTPQVKAEHICGDFLEMLEKLEGTYDLIILGYSLHHLSSEDKKRFFALIAKVIDKEGKFLFYDIYAKENESSSDYLDRACYLYREKWVEISCHEMDKIVKHVTENDLVEQESFYKKVVKESGLSKIEKKFMDKDELFAIYLIEK